MGALFLLAGGIGFLTACKNIKKQADAFDEKVEISTEKQIVEVRGDSIAIPAKVKIAPKYLYPQSTLRFAFVMKYQGKEIGQKPLKELNIRGPKARVEDTSSYITIDPKKGKTLNYQEVLPYTDDYKKMQVDVIPNLKLESEYDDAADLCYTVEPRRLLMGVITTPLTVHPTYDVLIAGLSEGFRLNLSDDAKKKGENIFDEWKKGPYATVPHNSDYRADKDLKPEAKHPTETIYFEINKWKLRQSEIRKPEVQHILEMPKDTNIKVRKVLIKGYASPDGPQDWNVLLSKNRAKVVARFVSREMARRGIKDARVPDFFEQINTPEDWEGLRKEVEHSDLPANQKQAILNILASNMSLDEKEAALRKADAWQALVDVYLPRLRRSEIVLVVSGAMRKVEEIMQVGDANLAELSKTELLLYAYNTKDPAKKRAAYQEYQKRAPQDWVGYNNEAVSYILEGDYEKAKEKLEWARQRFGDNDTILNNLGITYSELKDYEKALETFDLAEQKGIPQANNKGITYIKKGDYESAVASFPPDQCDYNAALAYTLLGEYDKAMQKLQCVTDKNADHFYLRAIIGARKGDKELLSTSLARAIELDPDLADVASEDLEFYNYWNTPEFKVALSKKK